VLLESAGACWSALGQVIEEKNIDLVILGTHGRTGIGELLLGSVAEAVFRHSPCPVITVGPRTRLLHTVEAEIDRVLYATDLGGHYDALPYAISIAEENNAQLMMLHVLEGTAVLPYDVPDKWADEAKAQMRGLLPDSLRNSTEFIVEMGRPSREILATALVHNADLIVMGVHADSTAPVAHTPWAIAHQVVGRAPCPVLTVRSK
jgi:nucleotide-binding universal stress UspA family protein